MSSSSSYLQSIHNGCKFIMNNHVWVEKLESLGLRSLLDLDEEVYPEKVKEVYEILQYTRQEEGEESVSVYVNNVNWWFLMDQFARLMEVPNNGIRFYSVKQNMKRIQDVYYECNRDEIIDSICTERYRSKIKGRYEIKIKHLIPEIQDLYTVLRENVTCRSMYTKTAEQPPIETVTLIEAHMLYWIKKGVKFNMAYIMINIMNNAAKSKGKQPLPYGVRITKMLRYMKATDGQVIIVPPVGL